MGRESDVKIVRVEQLSPFPWDLVDRELRRYPNAEVVWCQEEPMNMGAWAHVAPRFQTLFKQPHVNRPLDALRYAGRAPSASTATGYGSVHAEEQVGLVKEALNARRERARGGRRRGDDERTLRRRACEGSVASVCFDETPAADFNFVVQREKRAACSRDASTTAITKYSDWFICGF